MECEIEVMYDDDAGEQREAAEEYIEACRWIRGMIRWHYGRKK